MGAVAFAAHLGLPPEYSPTRQTPWSVFQDGPILPPLRAFSVENAPAPERLLPLQFQALLTLFSKFFSTFPRGTCVLSVSRAYLALDGVYHLLHAAMPCSTTPRASPRAARPRLTGLSPSLAPVFTGLARGAPRKGGSQATSEARARRCRLSRVSFQAWAVPRSLAATGGILVSFFSSA